MGRPCRRRRLLQSLACRCVGACQRNLDGRVTEVGALFPEGFYMYTRCVDSYCQSKISPRYRGMQSATDTDPER
ncbi:hypothetical protein MTO96_013715 [Rhipicephalus appendiculatus]